MKDEVQTHPKEAAAPGPGGLRFAEQFLIWATRVWVQAHGQDAGNSHHHFGILRTSFDLAGIAGALPVFDRLMTLVVTSRRREIGVHFPRCRGVSADELLLLRIVGDAQCSARRGARCGTGQPSDLDALVETAARPMVAEASAAFAACLDRRGMTIRSLETAAAGAPPGLWTWDGAGAGTVH